MNPAQILHHALEYCGDGGDDDEVHDLPSLYNCNDDGGDDDRHRQQLSV